ncbi:CrcB family protein [Bacillus sp. REN3]|uniref:fluoride efflux transporter FluC n=1 Tax=Bacillus sp. REN3 TaxID=2802440 RepID=UPI001AED7EBF|nr:CrcB family protein [Bacillus sp. REN3]
MNTIWIIAIGGLAGAISRFWVSNMLKTKLVPVSTIAVNLLGAFLLGFLTGKGIEGNAYLLAGTGFLGAFTTFSTLNVDLLMLLKSKEVKAAFFYFFVTYGGGGVCAVAGVAAGRAV